MHLKQQEPWQRLAECLRETMVSSCIICQENLYLFVSDERAGLAVDNLYPDIAHHLNTCSVCPTAYETLATLLTAALENAYQNHEQ